MPAFRASGRAGQASTTASKSGSKCAVFVSSAPPSAPTPETGFSKSLSDSGFGGHVVGLQIRSLVNTKAPKIEFHWFERRTDAHFRRLFSVIRSYLDDLDAQRFVYLAVRERHQVVVGNRHSVHVPRQVAEQLLDPAGALAGEWSCPVPCCPAVGVCLSYPESPVTLDGWCVQRSTTGTGRDIWRSDTRMARSYS
jgi:hypothetical protein